FSDTRRGPPALAGLTTLAARPLDHPARAGVFGSRLLRPLTEHPCSISNDSIARAGRVSGIAQFEAAGPLSRDVGLPQAVRPWRGSRKLVPDLGRTNRRARSRRRSLNPGAVS